MLTGHHWQNAYITRNIVKAVAEFQKRAEMRLFMETEVSVKLWTPDGEGEGRQKLAFVWIGDMQCELIQPVEGDVLKVYRDALPDDDSIVFHHVCHRVDDWDVFMAKVAQQEFPIVLRGGTPGFLEFCYLDTRPWLGHYTEYVWATPERWTQMGGI